MGLDAPSALGQLAKGAKEETKEVIELLTTGDVDALVRKRLEEAKSGGFFDSIVSGVYNVLKVAAIVVGLAVSSHRFRANPEAVVTGAVGSSPLSIAIPAGDQPPFVLDMVGSSLPSSPELMEQFPNVFFKALGIGSVSVILGGVLAGI